MAKLLIAFMVNFSLYYFKIVDSSLFFWSIAIGTTFGMVLQTYNNQPLNILLFGILGMSLGSIAIIISKIGNLIINATNTVADAGTLTVTNIASAIASIGNLIINATNTVADVVTSTVTDITRVSAIAFITFIILFVFNRICVRNAEEHKANDPERAISEYKQALTLYPYDRKTVLSLAQVLLDKKRFKESLYYLNTIGSKPEDKEVNGLKLKLYKQMDIFSYKKEDIDNFFKLQDDTQEGKIKLLNLCYYNLANLDDLDHYQKFLFDVIKQKSLDPKTSLENIQCEANLAKLLDSINDKDFNFNKEIRASSLFAVAEALKRKRDTDEESKSYVDKHIIDCVDKVVREIKEYKAKAKELENSILETINPDKKSSTYLSIKNYIDESSCERDEIIGQLLKFESYRSIGYAWINKLVNKYYKDHEPVDVSDCESSSDVELSGNNLSYDLIN
jgi:hypothetical protein